MFRASTMLLGALASTAFASPANAVQPLASPEDATAMCATAAPVAASERRARPQAALTEYLARRRGRLLDTYSATVPPAQYGLGSYDTDTEVLRLVTRDVLETEAGSVEFDEEPLFTFSVDPKAYEELRAGHARGSLGLRVTFALESLWHPELPYCTGTEGPTRPTIRARAVAAELVNDDATAPLARHSFATLAELDSHYGLALEGAGRRGLRVRVENSMAASGATSSDEAGAMVSAVEELVFPCFLGAIAQGGPARAALVLEVDFEAAGEAQSVAVAVDATGYPPLGVCCVDMLEHLKAPKSAAKHRARFTTYFEVL